MAAGRDVIELYRDAYALAASTDTALDNVTNTKLLGDLFNVNRLRLVREGRIASDDEEPAQFGKRCDDVLADAVGKIFLFRVTTHVDEWKHGNGRTVEYRGC